MRTFGRVAACTKVSNGGAFAPLFCVKRKIRIPNPGNPENTRFSKDA